MDNTIQIEMLRYAIICGKGRLFYDLIINYPVKSGNLKLQGSLCVLLLLCFSFRSNPSKSFSKVAVLKFRKIPWKTYTVDFYFSCRV